MRRRFDPEEWLLLRRLRESYVLWLGLPAAFLALPAAAQTGRTKPVVTAAVQVTRNPDPSRAHSNPQIAVNPTNGELVIVEAEVRNSKTCNVHISVDDGQSWFPGGDPMMEPYTNCSLQATNGHYVSLQFDKEGVLHTAFLGSDPALSAKLNRSQVPRHVFYAKSTDGGRTFTTVRAFEAREDDPGIGGTRRPMIAVDPSDSRYLYIGWQKGQASTVKAKAIVSASVDGGRTWAEPVDLSDELGGTQPRPAVGADGTVHAIFTTNNFSPTPAPAGSPAPTRPLYYRRSTDHGKSWSDQQEVDPGNAGFSFGRKWVIAADPNSPTVYVSWYGNPKPSAMRPEAVPYGVTPSPPAEAFEDRDVYVRVSTDAGRTWSQPRTVNDDAHLPNVQHYDPGLAIAPNGRLDVAWYDFRNSPIPEWEAIGGNAGGYQDVYYASSSDRGKTFGTNIRITDRIIDRNIGIWSNNVHGHTNVGIASTNESVYFAWQDSRNGNADTHSEDIYFASLKLNGPVLAVAGGAGVPAWAVAGAAVALGMGVAMIIVLGLSRRWGPAAAPAQSSS